MIIYEDFEALFRAHQGVKKWNRSFQAIMKAPELPIGEAHSVVDSLTYTRSNVDQLADSRFVGHQRYFEVIQPLNREISVEVAPKSDLERIEAYSDLTDREWFEGRGTHVTLQPGSFLVTDINEALRLDPKAGAEAAVYRITVEGASFHNK